MFKKYFLTIVLLILVIFTGFSTIGLAQTTNLTFFAPPGTSPIFAFYTGLANSVMTAYDDIQVTVVETDGAIDMTRRIRDKAGDIGNSMVQSDYYSYEGLDIFEGEPNKDHRILAYYQEQPYQWFVSKDSDVEYISDLEGKRWNPGATGGSIVSVTKSTFELLDINPNYFEATQADALNAYSDRQIIGMAKLGPVPDSLLMQANANRTIRVIGMTDEQREKVIEKFVGYVEYDLDGKTVYNAEGYAKWVAMAAGIQTHADVPQEIGYKIFKAIWEIAPDRWKSAYPTAKDSNLPELTLKNSLIPLHAGSVQYLKELGYDVPERLIPPEYQEK